MSPIAPYRTIPPVLQVVNVPCPHCQSAIQVDRQDLARPGGFVTNCIRCKEQVVLTSADVPVERQRRTAIHARGKDLIVANGAESEPRCVKCNAPAQWRWSKTLGWHSPYLAFLILLGLLGIIVYAILASSMRKSGQVTLYLCPDHVAARRRNMWVGWLIFASSVVFWVAAGLLGGRREDQGVVAMLIILGGLAFLVGLFVAMRAPRVVWPRRIEGETLTLRGSGPAFRASLAADWAD